jgi:phage terminase small subunit
VASRVSSTVFARQMECSNSVMAKVKHNPERPESPAVKKALAAMDMEALGIALTPRQKAFCREYIVDFNGTAAAVRAGYATQYADRQAHQLLKHKGVAAYIEYSLASQASKIMSVDADYIIQGILGIINDDSRHGDKLRGYELLARLKGLFIDKQEITGKDGGAIEVEQRRIEEDSTDFIRRLKAMSNKDRK